MAVKSAKAGKARGQLKAASKTSPGTAALSDVQDLDFFVELMLDEGLSFYPINTTTITVVLQLCYTYR